MSGSSTHMNVEEVGAAPWLGAMPLGCPPLPYKRPPSPPLKAHLLVKDLSPPFRISPWSRISEIHVPGGFFWKDLLLPLLRWSEGAEVVGVPVRVCDHGCTTALRCWT